MTPKFSEADCHRIDITIRRPHNLEFQQVVNAQARNPETYDAAAIETARQAMITKQAAIDACTTHDALDAL